MTPIGEQLRAARERKGLTLDRVADETNIAKRYLAGLEAEDFTVFPGRSLRHRLPAATTRTTSASPSDDFVTTYKNMKIQEQPCRSRSSSRGAGPPLVHRRAIGGAVLIVTIVLLAVLGGRGESRLGAMRRAPRWSTASRAAPSRSAST